MCWKHTNFQHTNCVLEASWHWFLGFTLPSTMLALKWSGVKDAATELESSGNVFCEVVKSHISIRQHVMPKKNFTCLTVKFGGEGVGLIHL